MRVIALTLILGLTVSAGADELESRALTHYVPQDQLEEIVRKEGWTEIVLKPYGNVRKGDKARIWCGGVIDRGGDQPGKIASGPDGPGTTSGPGTSVDPKRLSLSANPAHAYALLFKTEDGSIHACPPPGKSFEFPLGKEGAKLWIGFNDERGRFNDNHLGQGRRHERDPAWVRIEVIRIIVD